MLRGLRRVEPSYHMNEAGSRHEVEKSHMESEFD